MFTDGQERYYERIMKEQPRTNKNSGIKPVGDSGFRYRYEDVACDFCLHHKNCNFDLCPHIMDNLADLAEDKAFIDAIENAAACDNRHKQTLLHLKEEIEMCANFIKEDS